jgi:hypothetical protein
MKGKLLIAFGLLAVALVGCDSSKPAPQPAPQPIIVPVPQPGPHVSNCPHMGNCRACHGGYDPYYPGPVIVPIVPIYPGPHHPHHPWHR